MYFFELNKSQIISIEQNNSFDINGAILYDSQLNQWHIKSLTKNGWSSKKPLMSWFDFDYKQGDAIINDEVAIDLIANYTKLPKTFVTPEERYQREKAFGMIALSKKITDEIR